MRTLVIGMQIIQRLHREDGEVLFGHLDCPIDDVWFKVRRVSNHHNMKESTQRCCCLLDELQHDLPLASG